MKDFSYWKKLYDRESLEEFSSDPLGLLWLKAKGLIRKELINEFLEQNKLELKAKVAIKQFPELFSLLAADLKSSHKILNAYIVTKSREQLESLNTKELVSELFKLKHFEWGDHQNDLNKLLVSRYVKIYKSFDQLLSKFEKEINPLVQNYVINSWYNHWSSILIEHIFKSHKAVLPTVGKVRSVDFFINDIPFDLKVTYLPSEYIKERRSQKGYPVELTYLKSKAREAKIEFDSKGKPGDIYYEITEKLVNKDDKFSRDVLKKLRDEKLEVLKEAQDTPAMLSTWLYENQSAPRFGSENRIYLVLVDTSDFSNSWKLKRDLEVLKPSIFDYLDKFKYDPSNAKKLAVKYAFPKGSTAEYSSLADVIFVVK